MTPTAPEYVLARRALLDVLEVLESHRGALILVGAQAVYFHAPTGFGESSYTTDADLAIDPQLLATEPEIAATLGRSQYSRATNPGSWASPLGVQIDLMVPDALVAGRSRRSAPLEGHQVHTARRTAGLELALADNALQSIEALESGDLRHPQLKVAGPAALVVAKTVKIRERLESGVNDRILPKDAGDLLRLLRMCDAHAIGRRLHELSVETPHADLINAAIAWTHADVQGRGSRLVELAIAAAQGAESGRQIDASVRNLVNQLADAALGQS